ncbi:MAG: DUF5666 domain-containing protein [bacterium]|nr:DUF5666 domain-containing protein [bacterium]
MDTVKWCTSSSWRKALWALGGLVILLLIFRMGAAVGYRKAHFAYRWGEQYHRNFGGPRGGCLRGGFDRAFIEAHGTVGSVLGVDDSTIVLRGRDDVERIVQVGDDTVVRRGRRTMEISELRNDDRVVVIGDPNEDGTIAAKFIRVFPARDMRREE